MCQNLQYLKYTKYTFSITVTLLYFYGPNILYEKNGMQQLYHELIGGSNKLISPPPAPLGDVIWSL